MSNKTKNTFEITSGVIVASDPCDEIPTGCQGIIENVKKGTWLAKVEMSDEGDWGNRIAKLTIIHKDEQESNLRFKKLNIDGGVDSGQFGFFDKDFYRNDESTKYLEKADFGDNYDIDEGDKWYRCACKLTLNEEKWGVLPQGAVSSSGFGDGSYPVYGAKDAHDEYVGFQAVFIEHEEN